MKYFTINELIASHTAFILGIKNIPGEKEKEHLKEMTENLLDPMREAWGSAVVVNSGYRCKELNDAVGGSKTSAHPLGYAVDVVPRRKSFDEFVEFVVNWVKENNIAFDQILIESNSKGARWLHIGYKNEKGKQRRQIKNIYVEEPVNLAKLGWFL